MTNPLCVPIYIYIYVDEVHPLKQLATKSEPATPNIRAPKRKKPVYAESSSDDDTPLASSPSKLAKSDTAADSNDTPSPTLAVNGYRKPKLSKPKDSDDDHKAKKKQASRTRQTKASSKKSSKKEEDRGASANIDNGAPKPAAGKRKRVRKVESDAEEPSSEDDKPLTKKKKVKEEPAGSANAQSKKVKKEEATGSPKKGRGKKKEEEEAEEVFKWWVEQNLDGDDTVKWQTLEHNGVIFPPPYEPLPSEVKMKYNGI
jgi:DNA topoisomerase I